MAAHHREALQPVLLQAKIRRHAALPVITAAERHPDQIAAEIVGPLMIRADELLGRAATDRAELGAAMGAAIDENLDLAGRVAHGDDFFGAEPAALEVSGFCDLRFETDIEPARTFENHLLLTRKDPGIRVDPVRDARASGARPSAGIQRVDPALDRVSGSSIGRRHAILIISRVVVSVMISSSCTTRQGQGSILIELAGQVRQIALDVGGRRFDQGLSPLSLRNRAHSIDRQLRRGKPPKTFAPLRGCRPEAAAGATVFQTLSMRHRGLSGPDPQLPRPLPSAHDGKGLTARPQRHLSSRSLATSIPTKCSVPRPCAYGSGPVRVARTSG